MISKRNQQKAKKTDKVSLLSVESSQTLKRKKVVEMKDTWVKVRATMDSGAAGHAMPETMFPHVKLERRTWPKKFVAANGDQIKDLGEKSIPLQDEGRNSEVYNVQKRECCEASHHNAKRSSELDMSWCWMKGIRTFETLVTER